MDGLFHLTMSAIGTKRTSLFAPHMSAFGGKADITILRRSVLTRKLLNLRREG